MYSLGVLDINNGEFKADITHFEDQTITGKYIRGDYYSPPEFPEFNYKFGYAVCEDMEIDDEIYKIEIDELFLDEIVEIDECVYVVEVEKNEYGDGIVIKFSY